MISVIIPHHNEGVDILNNCLSSLDTQQGIDFLNDIEILIINDDEEGIIKDFSKYSNINRRIRQFFNPKTGYMGISRQIGIDNAKGDYVLFIDSDDMLTLPMLICDIISRTKVYPHADVFCYKFFEESIAENKQYVYLFHDYDFIWMFAKCYKKEFLLKNNIRFHNEILWHEDTYFNQVLQAYNPQVEYIDFYVYLWHNTPESITRKNSAEYGYSSLTMYIDAIDKVLERLSNVFTEQQKLEKAIWLITYIYCALQKNTQTDFREQYRKNIENKLSEFAVKWDRDEQILSSQFMPYVSEIIQAQCNGGFLPIEGVEHFIKRIKM